LGRGEGHRLNCNKFGKFIRPPSMLTQFIFGFRYLAPFQNAGVSKASGVKKLPLPINIKELICR